MIVIGILTHHDLPRLRRAVRSAQNQRAECGIFVEINTKDKAYREAVREWCKQEQIACYSSVSNGTPGKGKQAVFKRFLKESDASHLLLLDGDDWLYPCAIESLTQTVSEIDPVDVLCLSMGDSIGGEEITIEAVPSDPKDVAKSKEGSSRPTFFSRRAAKALSWDTEMVSWEDVLFLVQASRAHVDGQLTAVMALYQDIMVYDYNTPHSVQKVQDREQARVLCNSKIAQVWHGELPSNAERFEFHCRSPLMTDEEKEEHIVDTFEVDVAEVPSGERKVTSGIAIGILTHHDLPRLRRAVRSVQAQRAECAYFIEINTKDKAYREAVREWCKQEQIACYSSVSNGTPGKGKQAVFKRFLKESDASHLLLLDGDDWLYPCAIESLHRTLAEIDPVDVLISCAVDQVAEGHVSVMADEEYAELRDPRGRKESVWLYSEDEALVPGRPTFFSRRAAQALSWDTDLGCYEDGLFLIETIKAHQEGRMNAVCSLSQDLMVYDRDTVNSAQDVSDFTEQTAQLREKVAALEIDRDATSLGQLPALRPRPFITAEEKQAYIEATWDTTPRMARDSEQNTTRFVFLRSAFSVERMNNLIRHCEDIGFAGATYVDGSHRDNVKTVFLRRDEHPAAADFFRDIERIARQAAPQLGIDIWPEKIDMVQVARYLPGDHYGSHVDHDNSRANLDADRKISIFGSASPGGALEIEGETVYCSTGDIIVMSSISFHAAPEQREGTRYSFVVWCPGPQWR